MPQAHQIVLATATIVAANEAVLAPLAGHGVPWKSFNWRLVPATAITMAAFYGLEKVAPPLAAGLSVIMLVTVIVAPLNKAVPPPAVNIAVILGQAPKKGG